MNIRRGLRRIWIVAAVCWGVFVPTWGAITIDRWVTDANALSLAFAERKCTPNRVLDLNCYRLEKAKLDEERDTFTARFSRLFLVDTTTALLSLSGLLAAIAIPPALLYAIGTLALWIGAGFAGGQKRLE